MRNLTPTLMFMMLGPACAGGGGLAAYDPDAETDTDTDTDSDSDTDTDTDADSDSDSDTDTDPGFQAPSLISFEARDLTDRIDVAFRVTDPDNDIDGGSLELIVDGTPFDLVIPGDIDVWNPAGESIVSIPINVCDSGSHTFAGRVTDNRGLTSSQMSDSVSLGGDAVIVPETGDDSLSATDAGLIAPPTYICGDLYAASNDSEGYTGDQDWIVVEPSTSGLWTFTLTWSDLASDYDLHIYDEFGPVANSIQDGSLQPESVDTYMWSGSYYYIIVAGWNGNGGDWTLLLQ